MAPRNSMERSLALLTIVDSALNPSPQHAAHLSAWKTYLELVWHIRRVHKNDKNATKQDACYTMEAAAVFGRNVF